MRVFWRVEVAKKSFFPINSESSAPLTAWRMEANALKAGTITYLRFGVSNVLRLVAFSKVGESVVSRVSVRVINVVFGPNTVSVKPSQSMCEVSLPEQRHIRITGFRGVARSISSFDRVGGPNQANEDSGISIVGQKLFEAITSKQGYSPSAV